MAKSVIHINSQPLEGEFYVMGKKYLQKDLVLGRQIAEMALCLQKSQAVQEECQQKGETKGGKTKQEPKMTRTNPIKDGLTELDENREKHKGKQAILVDDKSQEEKTSKTTNEIQEPAKDPVTGATRTNKKSSQKLVQQWVKKEDCLKGDDGVITSSAKPQEQAKLPTQATKDNEETYVPPARINMSI